MSKLVKRGGLLMKIPTALKHKPVIVSENYENVDGRYAYDSDAKGLKHICHQHFHSSLTQ